MGHPRKKTTQRKKFTRKEMAPDMLAERFSKLGLHDTSSGIKTFEEMGLKKEVLKGIYGRGLEVPAPCQQSVIMPMIGGRDVICQAQSGMGKTAAFCISILQRLDLKDPAWKALVLAPTREIAEQILKEFVEFSKFFKNPSVKCLNCIGQTAHLKSNLARIKIGNFNIAVGTIGRVAHLLREEKTFGNMIKMLVIDEGDKMVTANTLRTDLSLVIERIAADAQVIVTSATMPTCALDRCNEFMWKPFKFLLQREQLTLQGIQQYHIRVGTHDAKLAAIVELFPLIKKYHAIVFCNTRQQVERVACAVREKNLGIEGMTGTMPQSYRRLRLQEFRSGDVPVLIASDLLGRGIDIHHVQAVVNYDLKVDEEYIHRIGRCGRYGKKGIAISFITDQQFETGRLQHVERYFATEIPEVKIEDIGKLINQL